MLLSEVVDRLQLAASSEDGVAAAAAALQLDARQVVENSALATVPVSAGLRSAERMPACMWRGRA